MELSKAKAIADNVVQLLAPFCDRIEVAGSILRQKPDPGDIEIICLPAKRELINFCQTVDKWKAVKGKPHGKYTQRILPEGIKLDLFMTHKDNYGIIKLIRIGDWEFSKIFMGTVLPRNGYKCQNGFLTRNGTVVPIKDEEELFELVGIPYVEPFRRTKHAL